ncbi:MAG: fused MFS/spermidine synthase [Methylococcales bacterium]|nr:fused MFS/spermidine synthase [Methylococcales bacterium]
MSQELKNNRHLSTIVLFAGTLFVSASLMFVLQPLFGKILLPLLGGSPAVWNTCMVFYQSILFLGYLYAHALSTRYQNRPQILIHLAVILISLLALPVALPDNTIPPTDSNPTLWLCWTLFLAIGLPFFVLSTTAPLIQKWFSNIGHESSDDPYFLYAASNTGSLLALLSYPFLLEPNIGLANQQSYWSIGYVLLCVLIAICAWSLWKRQQQPDNKPEINAPVADDLTWATKLHWLTLAFVPSSLLLGLTNFISTDIASVPLLWIIPLTVYLLSFIIVFSHWNDTLHPWMVKLQPLVLIPFIAYAFVNPADLPYWVYLILHVLAFFFAIMVCHGELAKGRPPTQHLTSFYLIMSFAGMLGGMFNTFVAPFVFDGIYEYPLMIVAALLLRPWLVTTRLQWQFIVPVVLLSIGLILYASVNDLLQYFDNIALSLIAHSVLVYFLRKQTLSYALTIGVIMFLALSLHGLSSHTLYQERSFFGVMAVRESVLTDEKNQPEMYHELFHGTTKHGAQRLPEPLATIPLTYYSQPGPMGQLFKTFDKQDANWNIGVVGLGAGALACYAKPNQHWTLYEIDPLVIDIAKNTDYFTYLSRCLPNATMRVGDARLALEKEPDQHFDLLMMDAFSSDAVPTHLLTKEAMELYFKKLKPNGILAFHITNRHLALKKVLSIHAEQAHFAALIQEFKAPEAMPLVVDTDWVVIARQPETLTPLTLSLLGTWQTMPLYFDMHPWTDDYTNIVKIWK